MCITRPTPLPDEYRSLVSGLAKTVIAAETEEAERRSRGERATPTEEMETLFIRVVLVRDDDGTAAIQWFQDQNIEHQFPPLHTHVIQAAVPLLKLQELSQVAGVHSVGVAD